MVFLSYIQPQVVGSCDGVFPHFPQTGGLSAACWFPPRNLSEDWYISSQGHTPLEEETLQGVGSKTQPLASVWDSLVRTFQL